MSTKIVPIILCGGSGERLLPFLKYRSPKQFLNLLNKKCNLFQDTALRFTNKKHFNKPIIVGNMNHRSYLMDSIKDIKLQTEAVIFEHEGRNTGPALAAVIAYLKESYFDENTLILVIPIDHYIEDKNNFLKRIESVKNLMQNIKYKDKIVTLSVKKTTEENNYGHLRLGKKISTEELDAVFEVKDFIEKPQHDMSVKNVVWNSGIYCMTVKACQELIIKNSPHIWHFSYKALTEAVQRTNGSLFNCEIILDNMYFSKNSKLSFDQILTMPYSPSSLICTDIGTAWEDVGVWSGIKRLYDKRSNHISGLQTINTSLFVQHI